MVQHLLQVSDLIIRMSQIIILMHQRNLQRRSRMYLKKAYSQRKHDVELRSASDQNSDESDQPRTSNPKNMLTRVNINLSPDMYHFPQTKTSPLWLNTGLLIPLGLTLIKIYLNMLFLKKVIQYVLCGTLLLEYTA